MYNPTYLAKEMHRVSERHKQANKTLYSDLLRARLRELLNSTAQQESKLIVEQECQRIRKSVS